MTTALTTSAVRHDARRNSKRLGIVLAFSFGASILDAAAVTCSISSSGVSFGPYDVFASGAVNANGTITVTCSLDPTDQGAQKITPYQLSLSTGSSNTFAQRTMKSGTNGLDYNLYTSNAYSTVWGDGTGSTSIQTGSIMVNGGHPSASNQFTVYGRIPALQDAAVASDYRDNVTVTLLY
jgi:spore coat protein U domain-containing protein, fimbrial subunit CupE1/2/3/6